MKRIMLNRSRYLISLLMAFVLVFTAACGGTTDTTDAPGTGGQTEGSNGTDAQDDDFAGYPMDTDVSVSWYVQHGFVLNSAYGSADESPFHSGLSEMAGVDIEWRFPTAGTDGTQDFNLMLNSDTLPDIIYGAVIREADRYIDEGVIRDLSDEIASNAPAFYEFIQTNELYDKAMKTDSGKYFGFGFFREDGGWNDSYQGPVVRQDWLTEQGLELPTTIDEFENVIQVFNEEYDAVFTAPWGRFNAFGIPGAFGAHGGHVFRVYLDDEGNVQLAQAQEEWIDYIAKLNEWWANGLLDQDLTANDDSMVQTKALNGVTGLAYTSMGQLSNWVNDAESAGNGAEWVGLAYPEDSEGNISSIFGGSGVNGNDITFISQDADEEKIPVILRLLDYAYTEDGNLYWNFGKEGVSWEYNDDNEVVYLPLVTEDPDGLNNAIDKFGGSTWSGSTIQATRLLYLKNTEVSIEANDTWFYTHEEEAWKDKIPAGVSFTADESTEMQDIQTPISTYISESAVSFTTGELSLDTFDDYLAQLESMNLARLLEIYQAAYDRFVAR